MSLPLRTSSRSVLAPGELSALDGALRFVELSFDDPGDGLSRRAHHDVAARVAIRERSRYEEPVTIPSEKEVMDLLAAADRLANSRNLQTQRTWERYRPILYLAIDSGMRPQEYLAVADAAVKDKGV